MIATINVKITQRIHIQETVVGKVHTTCMKLKEVLYIFFIRCKILYCNNRTFINSWYSRSCKHPFYTIIIFFSFAVHFNSTETCLSLQCTEKDTRFIPQNCSKSLDKMCDKLCEFVYEISFFYALITLYFDKFKLTSKLK